MSDNFGTLCITGWISFLNCLSVRLHGYPEWMSYCLKSLLMGSKTFYVTVCIPAFSWPLCRAMTLFENNTSTYLSIVSCPLHLSLTFFFRDARGFERCYLWKSPMVMCSLFSKPDWPVVHYTSTTFLASRLSLSLSEKWK